MDKDRSNEPSEEAIAIGLVRDGGSEEGGSSGGDGKWSDSGNVLKVGLTGFDNKLPVALRRKRTRGRLWFWTKQKFSVYCNRKDCEIDVEVRKTLQECGFLKGQGKKVL